MISCCQCPTCRGAATTGGSRSRPSPSGCCPRRGRSCARASSRRPGELVERERALAERLVVSGRRAHWDAWLRETTDLAALAEDDTEPAGDLVRDVVANHDALALGLPGAEQLH